MTHPTLKPAVLSIAGRSRTRGRPTPRRRPTSCRLVVPLVGLVAVAVAWFAPLSRAADRSPVAEQIATAGPADSVVEEVVAPVSAPAAPAKGELLRPAAPAVSATARSRTLRMLVTAYCPCTKCCGANARGVTASGKPVSHNRGRFVAADTRVLPIGTRLVVPGYHDAAPVQVLDTGGAIKGRRLDVYFPSHRSALEWGKRWVDVTVID